MWVTVSLVDLWREILCDLHRDRGQEVVCIGKLRVRALDESGLPTLHQDEAEAGCCRKREVDQEVFEGEDVGLDGLKGNYPRLFCGVTRISRAGFSGWC